MTERAVAKWITRNKLFGWEYQFYHEWIFFIWQRYFSPDMYWKNESYSFLQWNFSNMVQHTLSSPWCLYPICVTSVSRIQNTISISFSVEKVALMVTPSRDQRRDVVARIARMGTRLGDPMSSQWLSGRRQCSALFLIPMEHHHGFTIKTMFYHGPHGRLSHNTGNPMTC